jgi:hypothetical protein
MRSCGLRVLFVTAAVGFWSSAAFGEFIHPAKPGDPLIYGVRNGIVVALHPFGLDGRPQGGPRGLIRVGYEENGQCYLINYIAVEPLVGAATGFSELELGGDGAPGKRFWVGNGLEDGGVGHGGDVRGLSQHTATGGVLSFAVHVEQFANGARPVVEFTLYESAPERIRLRVYSGPGGQRMQRCVLTATMGNQSRCRWLWLGPRAVYAPALYADYTGTDFVEKGRYGLAQLRTTKAGDVIAAISPDEFEPRDVWPLPGGGWHHEGKWMAQFWLKRRGQYNQSLHCRVNGRRNYWAANVLIPGGPAYENFDFQEDFVPGQEIWFGYAAESPAGPFEFPYDVSPRASGRRKVSTEEQSLQRNTAETSRELVNGDFRSGFDAWRLQGGAGSFRILGTGSERILTTFGSRRDADTGRIYQCFQVPADAEVLRFMLHGGCDARKTYVALWHGEKLCRRMTARNDNTPFEVRWNVSSLRRAVVTLEVVDDSAKPWGFIGVHGFAISTRR